MALNRSDVVAAIADKTNLNKTQADEAIGALQSVLVDALAKGEDVRLAGLFTVSRTARAERKGRNPQTGAELVIPASFAAKITPASALKDAAKGGK